MIHHENKFEKAEDFLLGLLSEEEILAFEKVMESDLELKSYVEQSKMINESLYLQGLQQDYDKIKNAGLQYETNRKNKFYFRGFGVLTLLLLLGSGLFLYNQKTNSSVIPKSKQKEITIKNNTAIEETENKVRTIKTESNTNKNKSNVETTNTSVTDIQSSDSVPPTTTPIESSKEKQHDVINSSNNSSTEKTLPCPTITFDFNVINACENKANGKIEISNIQGGLKPYSIIIHDQPYNRLDIPFLKPNLYPTYIEDKNHCKSNLKMIKIDEISCIDPSIHFVFAYSTMDSWEIPNELKNCQKFSIYSQSGKLLLEKYAGDTLLSDWNGMDMFGGRLTKGVYIVRFEKDGNIISSGTVTIVE